MRGRTVEQQRAAVGDLLVPPLQHQGDGHPGQRPHLEGEIAVLQPFPKERDMDGLQRRPVLLGVAQQNGTILGWEFCSLYRVECRQRESFSG